MTSTSFGCDDRCRDDRSRSTGSRFGRFDWGARGATGPLLPSRRLGACPLVRRHRAGVRRPLRRDRPRSAGPWRERLAAALADGAAYATENFVCRPRCGVMDAARLEGDDALRTFDGRAQRHGLRRAGTRIACARWSSWTAVRPCPPDRLDRMHRRGHRGPRRHETLEAALASFRLLPRRYRRDPALLDTWPARESSSATGGSSTDSIPRPADTGDRRTSGRCSHRITAPTLIVRGEHSPVLTRPTVEEMAGRIAAGPVGGDRWRVPSPGAGPTSRVQGRTRELPRTDEVGGRGQSVPDPGLSQGDLPGGASPPP